MKLSHLLPVCVAIAITVAGCSGPQASVERQPGAPVEAAWAGKVLVSENTLPAGAKAKVLGKVSVDAKVGYGGGVRLYPMLADEARKLGANAVVEVSGYNRPTWTSWAAPFITGVAVKIDDTAALAKLKGDSY